MKVVEAQGFSIDRLRLVERPKPEPRRGDILVRVRAASLNYRDLAVLSGTYLPNLPLPYVPVSDACGVVESVGEGVTRFAPGDRVVPCYIQGWRDGALTREQRFGATLGGPLPGVLQEFVVVPAEDAVRAPDCLSDDEASTLPIAAVTAWSALTQGGLQAGQTVLVQGTGGVSLFAAQFAKASGARVIGLTSSAAKAGVLREHGAADVIDYRAVPEWAGEVMRLTGGRGADIVVETVGSTLPQTLACVAFGGFVAVVGFLGGYEVPLSIRQLIGPMVRMQGIVVGSRATLESLIRLVELHRLRPRVDRRFPLAWAADAFRHMERRAHMGKIVVTFD